MERREKILAAGLAVVILLWLGLPMIERRFLDPIRELEGRRDQMVEQLQAKSKQRLQERAQQVKLREWTARSLPPDAQDAQRLYSQWLNDAVVYSGWRDIEITLDRRTSTEFSPSRTASRGEVRGYTTIPVTMKGTATVEQLVEFLELFHAGPLLHRVRRLTVESSSTRPSATMSVELVAEGISMHGAPPRTRLFPYGTLQSPVSADATVFKLDLPPVLELDLPRIANVGGGTEFVEVVGRTAEGWEVNRGVWDTLPVDLPSGTLVELSVNNPIPDRTDLLAAFTNNTPFAKPVPAIPYNPRIDVRDAVVTRGDSWETVAEVKSWDPQDGDPVYELEDAPEGMEIDEETGRIRWTPDSDLPNDRYQVHVVARRKGEDDPAAESRFTVQLKDKNFPPVVQTPSDATFFLGQFREVSIPAEDPNEGQRLTYSLSSGAPEGMQIDPSTGKLRWRPAETLDPGTYPVTVVVSDSGEPAQSSRSTIEVAVKDDAALFTRLAGVVVRPDKRDAHFRNIATGESIVVKEGEELTIAEIQGTLAKVELRAVEIHADGTKYRLQLGQSLRQMQPIGSLSESTSNARSTNADTETITQSDAPPEVEGDAGGVNR